LKERIAVLEGNLLDITTKMVEQTQLQEQVKTNKYNKPQSVTNIEPKQLNKLSADDIKTLWRNL
jgi:hypothetical protein